MKRIEVEEGDVAPTSVKRPRKTGLESLSPSQRKVFDAAMSGKSLFFTGEAGTGKSYLLEVIVSHMRASGESNIYVTASTGVAACNIGGTTLHSFAGIGISDQSAEVICDKLLRSKTAYNKKVVARWRTAAVLFVDECSMLDPHFFERLNMIAKILRKSDEPFGGIQVILCGDFFQLPPVQKNHDGAEMLFQSDSWDEVIGENLYVLTEAHRQRDERFLLLLRNLRMGCLTKEDKDILAKRTCNPLQTPKEAVRLYATRKEVETVNESNLRILTGEAHCYEAHDKGEVSNKDMWMAPEELNLKLGARVMVIKNLNVEAGICNGAVGTVVSFTEGKSGYPVVRLENSGVIFTAVRQTWEIKQGDQVVASRSQVPLILAYAITIHKSQGMTLTRATVNVTNIFERNQLYVGLSRCTTLDGLFIVGFMPSERMFTPHPAVLAWWRTCVRV